MKNWTRDNTIEWLHQIENRIEDIEYYLRRTIEWCEIHDVREDETAFACAMMTLVWVAYQRGEDLSKREALEILQMSGWEDVADEIFELGPMYRVMDLEELLASVAYSWRQKY